MVDKTAINEAVDAYAAALVAIQKATDDAALATANANLQQAQTQLAAALADDAADEATIADLGAQLLQARADDASDDATIAALQAEVKRLKDTYETVPATVAVDVTAGNGTATLTWTVTPGTKTVDGVIAGRDGTSSTGGGAWRSSLYAGNSGSQTFTNLVNGQVYNLTATVVEEGVETVSASKAVTPQAPVVPAPTNTVAPAISGTAKVGETLTVSSGTWNGSPTFAYQWFVGGVAKSGATGTTYTPVSGDVGKAVYVEVTATNAGGSTKATSNTTANVADVTPPVSSSVLFGQYNGNPSENPDAGFQSAVGAYPEVASTYITTQAINQTYEKARVARGTSVFLDLDSKDTPGLIEEVANQTTAGMNYINTFLAAAEQVALSAQGGAKVFVAYVHEWEVKRAQNILTDAGDRDPVIYAKAHSVFNARAAQIAPHVLPGYWVGGFSNNYTIIAQVMAAMTTAPKWVSYDPYVTAAGSIRSAESLWSTFATWIKSNTTYQSWGSVPLYVTEYGMDTSKGDSACATFYSNLRQQARNVGLSGIVQFNRDKTDAGSGLAVKYKLNTGNTPQALAAFKASFEAN